MKTKLAKLLSGNILAQAIPLLALPFLARLYSLEEFGFFAFYVAICSMGSLSSAGRYDVAIIAATRASHKSLLARLSLMMIALAALVALVASGILYQLAIVSLDWLVLLPAGIVGVALFNLSNNLRNDQEAYGKLTLNVTSRSIVWVAVSLGLHEYQLGLLIAFALSYWFVALINAINIRQQVVAMPFNSRLLRAVAQRYRQYPLFNAPHALLTSANLNIPNLFLPAFGHTALLGAYSQANKALVTPWQLIANALFKIYFKTTATRIDNQQPVLPAFRKFLTVYAIGLLPVFVAGFWLVEPFMLLLLGEEWAVAGKIGVMLLPWIYLRAVGGILAFVPLILSMQRAAFLYEIAYSICMAACMGVSLWLLTPLQSIGLFALLGASFVLIQVIWYLLAVVKHDKNLAHQNAG